MNTWPNGHRHAISQSEHEAWNAKHYPGTRQLCEKCGCETGRCEDDSIYSDDGEGPLCVECWTAIAEPNANPTGLRCAGLDAHKQHPVVGRPESKEE